MERVSPGALQCARCARSAQRMTVLATLVALGCAATAVPRNLQAAEFPRTLVGRVVEVREGDRFVIKAEGELHVVRLDAIDAPDPGQPYVGESRDLLKDRVLGKEVRAKLTRASDDEAAVGQAWINGRSINRLMIANGAAWYWCEPGVTRSKTLKNLEHEVRATGRGLWGQPHPVAPWQFRADKASAESRSADRSKRSSG
jgi:micrococcal nuclease